MVMISGVSGVKSGLAHLKPKDRLSSVIKFWVKSSAYCVRGVHTATSIIVRKNTCHHTNSIEGHWSQLKRSIKGTHVDISSKHGWKYIAEFSYRRNMRHSQWVMFNLLVQAFSLPRLRES